MHRLRAMTRLGFLLSALTLASCAGLPDTTKPSPSNKLAAWMTGAFSSRSQSETKPSYYPVRLVMVPIWTDRDDGPWLYVEQAMESALERPYRQRVYRLSDLDNGGVQSEIYKLPGDESEFIGAWQSADRFASVTPELLELRTGCTIFLERDAESGHYVGSTRGNGCASSLSNASYATSEVRIGPDRVASWDRGFDASGEQVWGAVDGAYVFDRVQLESP